MARLTKFQKESYGEDVQYVLRKIDVNSWSNDILYRKESVDEAGNPLLNDYQIIAETKLAPDTASWVREIFLRLDGLVSYVKDPSEAEGVWHIYNGQYPKAVTSEQIAQIIQECSYQYNYVLNDLTRIWNEAVEMSIKRDTEGMDIDDKASLAKKRRKQAKDEFNFLFGEHKKVDNELRTSSRSKRLVDDLKHYVHRSPEEMKKHDKDYIVFKDYAFNARKFIDKSRYLSDTQVNSLFLECLEKPSPDILVMRGVDWELNGTDLIKYGTTLDAHNDKMIAPHFMKFLESSVCKYPNRLGREHKEVADMIELLLQGFGVAIVGAPLTARAWFGIQGTQSSGKSVLQNLIMEDMFPSYCASIQRMAFMHGANDKDASFALHNLKDMRLGFSDEIEGKLREDIIKQYSGGSSMSTEAKGKQAVSWEPQGILVLTSNKFYKFDYSDGAMLERFKPIMMNKSYNNAKDKDLNLGTKLYNERPYIFRVLLRACLRAVRAMEARGTDTETRISLDKRSWIIKDTPWVAEHKESLVVDKDYEYFIREAVRTGALEPSDSNAGDASRLSSLNSYYKMWKEKNNLDPPKRYELQDYLREKGMISSYRGRYVLDFLKINTTAMAEMCTGEFVDG